MYSYDEVKTWTSESTLQRAGQASKTILDCDKLFFPVNVGRAHWALAVMDLRKRLVVYYDSLWVRTISVGSSLRAHHIHWLYTSAGRRIIVLAQTLLLTGHNMRSQASCTCDQHLF